MVPLQRLNSCLGKLATPMLWRLVRGALIAASTVLISTMVVQAQTTRTISEGKINGLLMLPSVTPAPGIFVLHTAYGKVHPADVAMAKVLAAAGFVAFAPEYPLPISPSIYVPHYLEWFKARPEVRGQKLGAVGFSAGGSRVFYFAASDSDVKAVVSYYGTYDYKTASVPQIRALPDAGPIGLVDRMSAATLILHGDKDTKSTAD